MGATYGSSPVRVDDLRGRVSRRRVGKGSKSERVALCIDTGQGRFVLRRKGGPAFGDSSLERYRGKLVACSELIVSTTLIADQIRVVREADTPHGR